MKIAIIECVPFGNSKDAHTRQAIFIANYLKTRGHDCIVLYIDTIHKYILEKFDIIIKSYSTFYENYKDELSLYKTNKNCRFFYLTNEYTIQSSGIFSKQEFKQLNSGIITNFETKNVVGQYWKTKNFVNLNSLFYNSKQEQEKKYYICYYGTYRKNRKKYFKKYFKSKDLILSTSPKSIKKFAKDGCVFTPCKRFIWGNKKDTLGLFKYSLYIEDEWIHNNFHNLADRFYEALSNNTVTLFDKSCENTLKKSELKNVNYKRFLVNSYEELLNRNYEEEISIQKQWEDIVKNEKQKTFEEIEKILING